MRVRPPGRRSALVEASGAFEDRRHHVRFVAGHQEIGGTGNREAGMGPAI